jgi:hypothetical protein
MSQGPGNIRTLILAGAGIVVLCALAAVFFFDKPRCFVEMLYERNRIEKALDAYFAAEMRGDLAEVYRCLAPSSDYKRTHTYEDFLNDMRSNPVEIIQYEVVDIYGLRPNHDPQAYPGVERFAQVEVDVVLRFEGSDSASECNFCFTFLKEGGTWFKG